MSDDFIPFKVREVVTNCVIGDHPIPDGETGLWLDDTATCLDIGCMSSMMRQAHLRVVFAERAEADARKSAKYWKAEFERRGAMLQEMLAHRTTTRYAFWLLWQKTKAATWWMTQEGRDAR